MDEEQVVTGLWPTGEAERMYGMNGRGLDRKRLDASKVRIAAANAVKRRLRAELGREPTWQEWCDPRHYEEGRPWS